MYTAPTRGHGFQGFDTLFSYDIFMIPADLQCYFWLQGGIVFGSDLGWFSESTLELGTVEQLLKCD